MNINTYIYIYLYIYMITIGSPLTCQPKNKFDIFGAKQNDIDEYGARMVPDVYIPESEKEGQGRDDNDDLSSGKYINIYTYIYI
jgi:hypothetical protein